MGRGMRRRTFLVSSGRAALGASLLPLVACSRAVDGSAESAPRIEPGLIADLEKQIPILMAEARLPGLSIAVIKDARVMWRRGFGVADNASRAPVDTDTVFEAGSMSKPVFAYAVLKLCEKGLLDLDTPLTKYIPVRVVEGDARLDLMTARHVLSHTGGFQNWRTGAEPLAIQFAPGEKWLYSGEGYSYLQSVVTHLTGRVNVDACASYEAGVKVCATDIDQYMKAHLLVPFGMLSSGYVWNSTFAPRAARPHDPVGTPLTKSHPTATDAARYASAGGLHSTPTDFAKFLVEVINPKASDAFRLKRDTLAEMVRPVVKTAPDDPRSHSWALGWQVLHTDNGPVIAHGGDNPGFHAFAAASVERKTGLVIMTNGDSGPAVLEKLIFGGSMDRVLAA